MSYKRYPVEYNQRPVVDLTDSRWTMTMGWAAIGEQLNDIIADMSKRPLRVVIETYPGVLHEELWPALAHSIPADQLINSLDFMLDPQAVADLVQPDVTDDRLFGRLTELNMPDFFSTAELQTLQNRIKDAADGVWLVYGPGATCCAPDWDLLIYADMARWEIQQRMRRHLVDNLGVRNRDNPDWMLLYKQGFFVDWRVCDRLKKQLYPHWDYFLDSNIPGQPKLIAAQAIREALETTARQPFSVAPFFDPGPWGGQWMKDVCNLDPGPSNYAWCFNAVPEENSLLLKFSNGVMEIPALDVVFFQPLALLGEAVYERFGDEFPIRFDFLDTMDGGNLSLQVHPVTSYIKEQFGLSYTQDESYYLLDAAPGAEVYLGLKEDMNPQAMMTDLELAKHSGQFNADAYVERWPVKKHDHVLIPAGTVHCSGKDCMVLEISATPYLFTFKLWDWGRLGLDGRPRPINLDHGRNVIQWDRTRAWVERELINQVSAVQRGEDWLEERTGLHASEFIETRRHWFTGLVPHHTQGGVQVLCLVEGAEVLIESPTNAFKPFKLSYAEVVIIPAAVGAYTVRPCGFAEGKTCGTIKGYVRT